MRNLQQANVRSNIAVVNPFLSQGNALMRNVSYLGEGSRNRQARLAVARSTRAMDPRFAEGVFFGGLAKAAKEGIDIASFFGGGNRA
jgi:hypothetical protein